MTQPEFKTLPAMQVACIHLEIPVAEVMRQMDLALREITEVMSAKEVERNGPWFAHHLRRPTDRFDCNVCFPTSKAVRAVGRVSPLLLPAVQVVQTTHHGDYGKLVDTWQEFAGWAAQHHLRQRGDFYEVYVVEPRMSADPASWVTELNIILSEANA